MSPVMAEDFDKSDTVTANVLAIQAVKHDLASLKEHMAELKSLVEGIRTRLTNGFSERLRVLEDQQRRSEGQAMELRRVAEQVMLMAEQHQRTEKSQTNIRRWIAGVAASLLVITLAAFVASYLAMQTKNIQLEEHLNRLEQQWKKSPPGMP